MQEKIASVLSGLQLKPFLSFNPDGIPERAAVSLTLIAANLYSAAHLSRALEGTVHRDREKALMAAGTIAVTAVNAIVNYAIWS